MRLLLDLSLTKKADSYLPVFKIWNLSSGVNSATALVHELCMELGIAAQDSFYVLIACSFLYSTSFCFSGNACFLITAIYVSVGV